MKKTLPTMILAALAAAAFMSMASAAAPPGDTAPQATTAPALAHQVTVQAMPADQPVMACVRLATLVPMLELQAVRTTPGHGRERAPAGTLMLLPPGSPWRPLLNT